MQFRHQIDKIKQQTINPGLYVVSTPIGNMEDITLRALNVLTKSHIILCEDTRRSSKLLNFFKIKNKLFPYHKFNEKKICNKIIDFIKNEKIVSLISDAGTPTISDPGLLLVSECIKEKINIYPIPGASAVTSAVSISGFEDKYFFYGFLPKNDGDINKILKILRNLEYSIVFFVSAKRINYILNKFREYFFGRKIFIAREMTKIYESSIRDKVESIKNFPKSLKGELTVILSKKNKIQNLEQEISDIVKFEIKKMLKKYTHKDVVEFISKKENLQKKMVYDYCLKLKK